MNYSTYQRPVRNKTSRGKKRRSGRNHKESQKKHTPLPTNPSGPGVRSRDYTAVLDSVVSHGPCQSGPRVHPERIARCGPISDGARQIPILSEISASYTTLVLASRPHSRRLQLHYGDFWTPSLATPIAQIAQKGFRIRPLDVANQTARSSPRPNCYDKPMDHLKTDKQAPSFLV